MKRPGDDDGDGDAKVTAESEKTCNFQKRDSIHEDNAVTEDIKDNNNDDNNNNNSNDDSADYTHDEINGFIALTSPQIKQYMRGGCGDTETQQSHLLTRGAFLQNKYAIVDNTRYLNSPTAESWKNRKIRNNS